MAESLKRFATVDPVWDRITREAQEAVEDEPLMGGLIHACILHHKSIEKALSYRIAAKLSSNEMSMVILREIADRAYEDAPELVEAARADLMAVYERDPACHRFLQPILYFKGYQAVQSYRVGHWLWAQGQRDLAYFFQMRVSEIFGIDIHPAARVGKGIMIDHAHSIVIGETAVVGDNVSMLHAVTLGGTGKEEEDRHPKIGNGVLIGAGAKVTGGRGRLYDSVLDTIGDTPCIRVNNLAPEGVTVYVKAEAFNPGASVKDRLAAQHHRGRRAGRNAEARPDRGRGDLGQHRHRARHGLRGQGLSAGGDHGRELLGRAPPADADARRKGRADAQGREGLRHVQARRSGAGRGEWLVPRQPVRDRRQRRHPRGDHGARDPRPISTANGSTTVVTGYGTGGTVTGIGRVLRKERPDTKIILSEPANAAIVSSARREAGRDARPRADRTAIRPSSRIRSRAGRRISSPGPAGGHRQGALLRRADPGRRAPTASNGPETPGAEEGIFTGISGGSTFAVAMQEWPRRPRPKAR
jgi:serine O-acetyltransferase